MTEPSPDEAAGAIASFRSKSRDRLQGHVGQHGRTREPVRRGAGHVGLNHLNRSVHTVLRDVLSGRLQGDGIVVEGEDGRPPQFGGRDGQDSRPGAGVDQWTPGSLGALLQQLQRAPGGGMQTGAEAEPGIDDHVDGRRPPPPGGAERR